MDDPNFGRKRNEKRVYFMKEDAKSLITPLAQHIFESKQMPKKII